MKILQASSIPELSFYPHADLVHVSSAPRLWNINKIYFDNSSTTVEGWCLPHAGRLHSLKMLVNGKMHKIDSISPSGIYSELYPWFPNAAWAGFSLSIPHKIQDLRLSSELTFQPMPDGDHTGDEYYSLNVLVSDLDFAMPPDEVAARIGVTQLMDYVMLGRSIFRGFERVLSQTLGTTFKDYGTVVDWGCGSARVARHTVKSIERPDLFYGFDIDSHAVQWARENVGPHFSECTLLPPLPIRDDSVNLVYAYSIFTHMSADYLKAWTSEIHRILARGGIFLVTVLSDRAILSLLSNPLRSDLIAWRQNGLRDSSNSQLDTLNVSKDYYRNIWLTREYIKDLIKNQFDLISYTGSFHFYQDCLLLRKI